MRTRDEAKEASIRKQAMVLIVEEGFDGLSMHKLAKAANVSVATIYIYFKDRENLILTICKDEMVRMADAFLKGFDPKMSFEEGLKMQWKNRAGFWLNNPLEGQFLERLRHSPYHDKVTQYQKQEFLDAMHAFVRNAVENRELVKLPIEVFWSVAYAPLYQLVKFHMDGSKFPGGKPITFNSTLMNKALQAVLKGLRP